MALRLPVAAYPSQEGQLSIHSRFHSERTLCKNSPRAANNWSVAGVVPPDGSVFPLLDKEMEL